MSHLRELFVLFLATCLLYSPMLAVSASSPHIIPPARMVTAVQPITRSHKPQELLVKFRSGAPKLQRDVILQAFAKNSKKLKGRGGLEKFTIKDNLDLATTLFNVRQLSLIVEWAEPNYIVTKSAQSLQPNDPQFIQQWSLLNTGQNSGVTGADIGAPNGWQTTTGSHQTIIAVIDTGLDLTHPDLQANIWKNAGEDAGASGQDDDGNGFIDDVRGWNFVNDTSNVADNHGHGTQMAGLIAAVGNNSAGITGVMWQAAIMPIKALDASASGTIENVVEAIDYATQNHASVINCSFGGAGYSNAMYEAIERAKIAGAIVVAAAGNNGEDIGLSPHYPAGYNVSNLISVAATTNSDQLATFSNWNSTSVHIGAPGVELLSTQMGGGYTNVTGTSASAPLVSGAAGLLKTLRPWVSAEAVKYSLIAGVRVAQPLAGKVSSSGVVNIEGAINALVNGTYIIPGNGGGGTGGSSTGGGINIGSLRGHHPGPPVSGVTGSSLPGPGYDDPIPTTSANFAEYYSSFTNSTNATGIAGSLPMQRVDPTAGSATVGGISINLDSSNFNFTAPVVGLAGRAGLGLSLSLSYNSKVWSTNTKWVGGVDQSTMYFNAEKGFPGPGWRIGFGALQTLASASPYTSTVNGKQSVLYIAPDGTKHELSYNSQTERYESYDSSYLDFALSSRIMRTTQGTQITFSETATNDHQFLPTQIKDRNGNYISITYRSLDNGDRVIDYIIDTAGRRIDFYYQSNRLTEVRQNRAGTWYRYVVIDYTPVTIQAPTFNQIDPPNISGQQVYLPARVTYPTGQNFRFGYLNNGQMYLIEKWVPTIEGQGSERRIGYTAFNLYDGPQFTRRFEQAENWQGGVEQAYIYDNGLAEGYYITTPVGIYYRVQTVGMTQKVLTYAPGNSNPARQQQIDWIDDGFSYRSNPRIAETRIFDAANFKKVGFSYIQYNGVWLPQNKDEYIGNPGSVYRRTVTEYTHYPTQRIIGLPSQISVYAGAGTTLLTRASNTYDETSTFTDSNNAGASYFIDASADGVIQHDTNYGTSFTQRGNLTSATLYSVAGGVASAPRIVKRLSYDTNGNVRAETDGAGNRKQIILTDNYNNKPGGIGQTHVYIQAAQDPTGFRSGAQYNYYNGVTVKKFNLKPNSSTEEQVTTATYDFADRPLVETMPDTGTTSLVYYDSSLGLGTFVKFDRINGVDKVKYNLSLMDGAGRVYRTSKDHPDGVSGKFSGQQIVYDKIGRKLDISNIIAINGDWTPRDEDAPPTGSGWIFSHLSHDELNRLKLVTLPDNNTRQYNYAGCGCAGGVETTVIDEMGHKTITKADAMGRLSESIEEDLSTQSGIYSRAEYIYNHLDQIVEIKHWNGYEKFQSRTFVYDGYGRKQSETTPESGTVSYTYQANDAIATVTDARGKVTTHTYNTRNLLTGISYSDGGLTPSVTYTYDEYGARQTMVDGEGSTGYVYDSFRRLQSESRSFTSLPGILYSLSYNYNYAGQPTKVNYIAGNAQGGGGVGGSALYTISGQTRTAANVAIPNSTITMTGGQARVTTSDASGYYWFFNVPSGSTYHLNASKTGYSFTPAPQTYINLNSNKTANFTGTPDATPTPTPTPVPTPTPPPAETEFNKTINYSYSAAGALIGVGTDWTGGDPYTSTNVVSDIDYRAFGLAKQVTYGNGRRLRLSFSGARQQLTNMTVDRVDGTDQIVNYSYEYGVYDSSLNLWRNDGKIRSISDNLDNWYSVGYTYDNYGRLSIASSPAYTRSYQYDPWGNLKQVAGFYTLNYATNASGAPATNRILNIDGSIPASYDAAGNMTQEGSMTYSYDAASRLKEVGSGGQNVYGYDGDGQRVRKVSNGGSPLHFVRSSVLGQVAFEARQGESAVRVYIYAGKKQIAVRGTDRGFYWTHTDHLGSLKKLTRTNGTVAYRVEYDPHGQALYEWSDVSTNLNSHKFTGYERDAATGLDYAQARMYQSNRGRFNQPDPLGIGAADLRKPQSLNRYSYVLNDPVNHVDPSGLLTIIIGGTFTGDDPDWAQPGTDFWRSVTETFGEDARVWTWGGHHVTIGSLYLGIINAGFDLADFINNYEFQEGEKLNIVTHSHGGNVAKVASWNLKRPIDNLVTLGNPQNDDLSYLGWTINLSAVDNYCNVSSFTDVLQFIGASPVQIYYTGLYAWYGGYYAAQSTLALWRGDWHSAGVYAWYSAQYFAASTDWYLSTKIDPYARNVLLANESHSDLHTPRVWDSIKGRCGLQ